MQLSSSNSLFLRFTASSPPRQAISILAANFSSSNVRVSVWWDFENCNLPTGANVYKVAQTITSSVRINGIKGPITISAFGNILQLSRTNQEALTQTGINLTHVPQGGKNSADRSLITDLMYWVTHNPPPAHLFLISSDRDFASVLHRLRMNNYNILLAGYEDSTPGVLCSAASIMWDWNALVRGKTSIGKCFNQPPDGPYNSWYGHYKTPLLDPFTTTTKQQSCTSVKTVELRESGSFKVFRPIPNEVVEEIGLVLSLYHKGAAITELREQLRKRNVSLDKDFYGYKSFLKFLLSMPEILHVVPKGDGVFLVHGFNQEMDNKASLMKLSCENHKVVTVEKNDEDVKEESHRSQESSQESVLVTRQKAKDEPVKENQLALTAGDDVSSSSDGFLKKLNRLWLGSSPETEVEHLQCVLNKGKVVDKDLESRIASSTSIEVAKEVKADDTEEGNKVSKSPGILSRILKRFQCSWGGNTELSNAGATETQADLNPLPFRVTRVTEKTSCLSNPPSTNGLRSIFVNMSKSQCDHEANNEKKSKNISVSQRPTKRSRSKVIADCQNLIKKITEENPGGYNMGDFKKDFLERFGYRLDNQKLGYSKLQSLIQMMPEARIESGYIVPSSTPAPYDEYDSSSFEELGPVSKKIHEYEPSVSEEEDLDSQTDKEASLKQSSDERKNKKKNKDETKSDLLQILGCWDNVKEVKKQTKPVKTCAFGEDKLVEDILISLGKKPLGESRIQG